MKSTPSPGRERRYFPRVNYRAYATLVTTSQRWPVHILDLSFNGALVALIHKHNLRNGEGLELTIELDNDKTIKMRGRLAHQKEHFLGIQCRATSVDYQKRLRELLDKNKHNEKGYNNRSLKTMVQEHSKEN